MRIDNDTQCYEFLAIDMKHDDYIDFLVQYLCRVSVLVSAVPCNYHDLFDMCIVFLKKVPWMEELN